MKERSRQRQALHQSKNIKFLKRAAAKFGKRTPKALSDSRIESKGAHMTCSVSWIQRYTTSEDYASMVSKSEDLSLDGITEWRVEGEGLHFIGNKLPSIIKGQSNPLNMLLEVDILDRIYSDDPSVLCCYYPQHGYPQAALHDCP